MGRDSEPPDDFARSCRIDTSRPWLERLHVVKTCPWLAWPFAALSLLPVYWGWTVYYGHQFAVTPWYLYPFVSDSPNAVLAFVATLVLWQRRIRLPWLDLLAWMLNIKVGLWTMVVLLMWHDEFFLARPVEQWILFWLHLGMVAQVLVHHRQLRAAPPGRAAFLAVSFVVLVDVLLDYTVRLGDGRGLHPGLPGFAHDLASPVGLVTAALASGTVACAWLAYARTRPKTGTAAHPGPDA